MRCYTTTLRVHHYQLALLVQLTVDKPVLLKGETLKTFYLLHFIFKLIVVSLTDC